MRQAILDQLKKCQWADVSKIDLATGTGVIPKYKKPDYKVNSYYLVKVPDDIVNNPNSVLAVNWNNGNYPACQYIKAYVSKILGKMIFVDALGFNMETKEDLQNLFSGWLDAETLTLITVL